MEVNLETGVMAELGMFVSLEEAGLEEDSSAPQHDCNSIPDMIAWWSDGEDSRYEAN